MRSSRFAETLSRCLQKASTKEITVNPDGGFFDVKTLESALRRSGGGGLVFLSSGDHTCAEIKRPVIIQAGSPQGVVIKGTLRIAAEYVILIGVELEAVEDHPAVIMEHGIAIFEGCTIKGAVKASPGTNLFFKNCLIEQSDHGISLGEQASIELVNSRVSGARIGLTLHAGCSGFVYGSRFTQCLSNEQSDWGAGIFAEKSEVYCQAASFEGNGVGLFLQDCPSTRLTGCYFTDQDAAAIVTSAEDNSARLTLESCTIERQQTAQCAQIAVKGGQISLSHTTIRQGPGLALSLERTSATLEDCQIAGESTVIEALSSHFFGEGNKVESLRGEALVAAQSSGSLRRGTFRGQPPVRIQNSPALSLEESELIDAGAPLSAASVNGSSQIDHYIESLNSAISHESVRAETKRVLRLAHAAHQRKLRGLPVPEQKFHAVFTGSTGTGKIDAARALAEGLYAFGITAEPELQRLDLSSFLNGATNGHRPPPLESLGKRVIFLSARKATSYVGDIQEAQRALEKIVQIPGAVLILEGERDEMRRLIRSNTLLERSFVRFLHFPSYGPIELTTLFAQYCHRDHIPLSKDGATCCLLLFHVHCDRKDRRFITAEGVLALYEAARQRYLERCSRENRFDLEMEPVDFDLPQDRAMRIALDRSATFASFCPSCLKENPWLPGLEKARVCLHCERPYIAPWGYWTDSASYRRAKEALAGRIESGAVARRAFRASSEG